MEDARRRWLTNSIMAECSLEHVAEAIATHARPGREVYVERRGAGYRWSPAHAGGSYPLHREVALTIDVDYHRFVLPFVTVDGRAIVKAGLAEGDVVAASFIEPTTDALENMERIRSALGNGATGAT